jgi:hypothetical protein
MEQLQIQIPARGEGLAYPERNRERNVTADVTSISSRRLRSTFSALPFLIIVKLQINWKM